MKTLDDKYIIKIQFSKEDKEAVGTGFFITSSGYILTCHHVVAQIKEKDYWVSWGEQSEPVHAEYCHDLSSEEMDFAILKISINDTSSNINILNFDIKYDNDEKIDGKGYQTKNYGDSSTPSPASAEIFGNKIINGNNYLILKDAVNVSQGLSGSPAFNKRTGKIIGVFTEQFLEREKVNDIFYPTGKQVVILPLHEIVEKIRKCNIADDNIKRFIDSVNCNNTEIYLFIKKLSIEDTLVAQVEWIFPEEKESLKYYVQIKSDGSKETVKSLDDYLENVHMEKVSKVKLKELAIKGSHLFDLLFSSFYHHRSSDIEAAKKSKKYISNIINTHNDKIFIESEFDIPWNCLYVKDPLDGIESEYFIGNSCRIAVINPFQGFSCEKNKYSNYAAHDYDIKQLYELQNIIKNKFDKIFYLECSEKTKKDKYKAVIDNKINIIKCQSLDDFCDAITENIPKLLFICFDEGFIVNSKDAQTQTSCIKIGNIELHANKLKERLSIIQEKPIFVIIVGRKSTYDVRVEFKKLFIMDLKWNGMIFMDGNTPLDFAIEYLCHFVDEFTKGNSISETMFKIRKKYKNDTKKNNIGLAFTAYFNKFNNAEVNI